MSAPLPETTWFDEDIGWLFENVSEQEWQVSGDGIPWTTRLTEHNYAPPDADAMHAHDIAQPFPRMMAPYPIDGQCTDAYIHRTIHDFVMPMAESDDSGCADDYSPFDIPLEHRQEQNVCKGEHGQVQNCCKVGHGTGNNCVVLPGTEKVVAQNGRYRDWVLDLGTKERNEVINALGLLKTERNKLIRACRHHKQKRARRKLSQNRSTAKTNGSGVGVAPGRVIRLPQTKQVVSRNGVYLDWVLQLGTKERNAVASALDLSEADRVNLVHVSRRFKQRQAHFKFREKRLESACVKTPQGVHPRGEPGIGATKHAALAPKSQPDPDLSRTHCIELPSPKPLGRRFGPGTTRMFQRCAPSSKTDGRSMRPRRNAVQ